MAFRYTLMGAVALAVTSVAGAQAQSPFPPVGQQQQQSPFPPVGQPSPFPPAGQQSPFPPIGQAQQQKPPCYDQFLPLRNEVDKRFEAAKKALDRRGSAAELCSLLTRFSDAEVAMIKYVEKNGATCGFPASMLGNIKASNVKSQEYRKQACSAAASPRPARPAEPTLSDALSPPVAGRDNTKTGRGTLDSLGGNPLAR